MAGTELKDVGEMKKGSTMLIDGAPCKVVAVSTSKPGKHGHAKHRIEGVGLIDGKKRQIVCPGGDVEVPIIEKRTAQVLSMVGDTVNVMDMESFETFDLKITDECEGTVTEGCQVLYWDIMGTKIVKQVKNG